MIHQGLPKCQCNVSQFPVVLFQTAVFQVKIYFAENGSVPLEFWVVLYHSCFVKISDKN